MSLTKRPNDIDRTSFVNANAAMVPYFVGNKVPAFSMSLFPEPLHLAFSNPLSANTHEIKVENEKNKLLAQILCCFIPPHYVMFWPSSLIN